MKKRYQFLKPLFQIIPVTTAVPRRPADWPFITNLGLQQWADFAIFGMSPFTSRPRTGTWLTSVLRRSVPRSKLKNWNRKFWKFRRVRKLIRWNTKWFEWEWTDWDQLFINTWWQPCAKSDCINYNEHIFLWISYSYKTGFKQAKVI